MRSNLEINCFRDRKRPTTFNTKTTLTRLVRTLLTSLIFGIGSTFSMADQFYLIVNLDCDPSKSKLVVRFLGYQNEDGEKAISELGKNSFDPRALVSFLKKSDGTYFNKTKSVSRTCVLKGEIYNIEIRPLMALNFHPEGFCASRIGAEVTVGVDRKIFVTEGFDACTEIGEMTTEFVISPHLETMYKKLPSLDFLNQR